MAKKKRINNNYFKLGLILVGVILLTVIFANIYKNINANKINSSYIAKYVSSIQYNELNNAKAEFSGDTFLYISYTGDKEIYNLETKLKKVVEENELTDQFIYLDIKNEMDKDDFLIKINDTLDLTDNKINKLPAIIYYKDNKVIEIIDSKDSLLNSGNFSQLLEKYEIVS